MPRLNAIKFVRNRFKRRSPTVSQWNELNDNDEQMNFCWRSFIIWQQNDDLSSTLRLGCGFFLLLLPPFDRNPIYPFFLHCDNPVSTATIDKCSLSLSLSTTHKHTLSLLCTHTNTPSPHYSVLINTILLCSHSLPSFPLTLSLSLSLSLSLPHTSPLYVDSLSSTHTFQLITLIWEFKASSINKFVWWPNEPLLNKISVTLKRFRPNLSPTLFLFMMVISSLEGLFALASDG